ncbi:hypothetical protein [Gracilimonas tropica]|uniref:hypothetical protein n=1 Tax=Gracilimonas tropica TaxID=454600 RepID=UPI00035E6D18|nr:hypothetical protein [Gracilimonas tropica]
MNKHNDIDGNEIAELLYGKRKKKRRKRIQKVNKPDHWRPDFDSNELKLKQK